MLGGTSGLGRLLSAILAFLALVEALAFGQQPTFRARVDIVHVDTSVFDKQNRPIHGLTAADFTVLIDGKPQPVVLCTEETFPGPVTGQAPWMTTVAPDAATNDLEDPRLWAIILDDATSPADPYVRQTTQAVARAVLDSLGPRDLAAVIFTEDNRHSQDFTADRAKLHAAIDTFNPSPLDRLGADYSYWTLRTAREFLAEMPEHRSAIVYIGMGPNLLAHSLVTGDVRPLVGKNAFAQVPIYGISPFGLMAPGLKLSSSRFGRASTTVTPQMGLTAAEGLSQLADVTGGIAIVNNNEPASQVPRIFEHARSYYALAYEATYPVEDGRYRRLEIRVARKGATIYPGAQMFRTLAPTKTTRREPLALTKALAGFLPEADLPLRAVVTPMAVPRDPRAGRQHTLSAVAIALGIRWPIPENGVPVTETLGLDMVAFDGEGLHEFGRRQLQATLVPRAGSTETMFDVLMRWDLKPGRYNLRFAARRPSDGATGSVYAFVTIPDYAKAPVTLSGISVQAVPGPKLVSAETVTGLLPVRPTSEREFLQGSAVMAFFRVYQGGKGPLDAAKVTLQIIDRQDAMALDRSEVIETGGFDAINRAADYRLELPMSTLAPGPYLLRVETSLVHGKGTARQTMRFSVR
jgi:VWFA-related protein